MVLFCKFVNRGYICFEYAAFISFVGTPSECIDQNWLCIFYPQKGSRCINTTRKQKGAFRLYRIFILYDLCCY